MTILKNMHFDFIKRRKIFFIISAVVFLIGIISLIVFGLNLDADFVGGTSFTMNLSRPVDQTVINDVRNLVKDTIGIDASSVQSAGSNGTTVMIKTAEVDTENRDKLVKAIVEKYELGSSYTDYQVSNVGASMTKDITRSLFLATIIAVVLMLAYIWIRFDLRSGTAAVICLIHDLFVMLTVYSLFHISVDSNLIAAFLTILGYSINGTIIVFDRIRENKAKTPDKSFDEIANVSINQTFRRSIYTTFTTLITIVMIYILGVASIKNFAFPLIVGILAGFYSSTCLASAIWAFLNNIGGKKKEKIAEKK